MSPGLALQLGAVTNLVHELKFGRRTAEADLVTETDLPAHAIRIGSDLAAQLQLTPGIQLALSRPHQGSLQLGPVVGLFTAQSVHPPWGEQTDLLAMVIRFGRQLGQYVYVFTPEDVDLENDLINGWRVTGDGHWVRCPAPLPDVIYDRVPSRKHEQLPEVVALKEKLQPLYGARYFNPGYLDKLQLHQPLLTDPTTARFLPETVPYTGLGDLTAMLSRHGVVFLKPVDSSLGRGVVRIARVVGGRVAFQLPFRTQAVTCSGPGEAARRLRRLTSLHPYLIQQGVDLATSGGSPFDVRVLAQKGGGGRWYRSKIYARVAALGSYLSNLSRGGTPADLGSTLLAAFPDEPARRLKAMTEVRALSRIVPVAVEKALGAQLGELGIDLGIDTSGRVWLIEVNSKPMRTLDPTVGSVRGVRTAIIRPLVYARYLADADSAGAAVKRRRNNE